MKRVKWLLLLCAFVLLWSSPGWATEINGSFENVNGITKTTDSNNATVYDLGGSEYTLKTAYSQNSGNVIIKNGKITSGLAHNTDMFTVSGSGTLTLEGGTNGLTVSVTDTTKSNSILIAASGGKITVKEGVTLSSAHPSAAMMISYGSENSLITVDGGTMSAVANAFMAGYPNSTAGGAVAINGGKISSSSGKYTTVSVANGGKVTITGGEVSSSAYSVLYVIGNNSTANITGGTISNTNTNWAVATSGSGGKITLNGGTITSEKGSGLIAGGGGTVEVIKGTITAYYDAVLAHENNATATITDGTFTATYQDNPVCVRAGSDSGAGTLTINGGTYNGDVRAEGSNSSSITISNGTFTPIGNFYLVDIKSGTGNITGGTFRGSVKADEGQTLTISGGVFTKDPSAYLAKDTNNQPTAYMIKLSDDVYKYGVTNTAFSMTGATITPAENTKSYDGSGATLTAAGTPEKISIKVAQDTTAEYPVAYTYAWTKGSETTSLGTAATYTTGATVADTGTYKCTVTYDDSNKKEAEVTVTINKATPTYTAPTGLTSTYGKTLADVTLPTASNGTWAWSDATTTSVGNAGTNTFKAQFTPSDTANYDTPAAVDVSIIVAKAKATVDTAPKEKTLTYTGSAQALVEAGKATGGTLQYAVGTTAGTYSSEIPTGTDAGSYTVWYKAAGTDNYDESEAKSLTVTIAKVTPTVTAPTAATGLTYNGSAQTLVTAGSTTGGTLEYSTDGTNYSTSIPTGTNAGSYTVSYRVTGGTNYNDVAAASVTATIAKVAASEITTQVGGTTTGTATTTNGKTNTKTSKTTTFTLGSGTGAGTMSADVAITTEEKLEAQAGSEFSTVVAVDTTLTGNKDFNQYAYSMDIVGLPSWITATGELTSSDTNAAGKTYHHEFTLKGTPAEAAEATSIAFTAWVTLSSDNYSSALKASADKSVEVTVTARPVPPVAPVLRIVDASEDKSLIITADVTNGSVTLSPDVVVEATAGTNFVWIVSGDLPKYLTATSTDKTLTISGYISDDLIAYSIVVIASNDVGSDSVKISFNVYKAEIDDTGAVTVTITSEDIEKIKETKGSDELTLSDVVDMTALNETLASSGGALKLSNGITTLEGISALSNLTTLDLSEVKTLTTTSLTADNLGSTTEIKIGENNTSITTVDLSGSKVETVTMQKSSVTDLKLGSSVKTVDAKDSATLKAIDFSQSTNVQSVNISGTQVASADLSNCTELVSFSFDVAPGGGTESAGALQTLKLPETSDKLENLAVRGNQLLWLSLGSSKYPNLKNINVRGQRRGGLSIKMAFDFLEFLWNLYQQSLYENEADYEEYTEGAEMPFDVTQISSDITYVASDDNSTQTATITNGKVNFIKTPKNFKYEYDTGFRRSGRTASTGSFITAEDEDEENGNMDVTIETGSVTGSAGGLESSSGGGCDAGFSYGALSALILVFATLKKRR